MADKLIAEGFEVFKDSVLARGWPDDATLQTLIEIAFFGGADWLIAVFDEEGYEPEIIERVRAELAEHVKDAAGRVAEAGDGAKEKGRG